MEKQHYYPVRDAENPSHIELIPVTEEQYRELIRDIWRIRRHAVHNGECFCPSRMLMWCDGQCDMCKYHRNAKKHPLSLDLLKEDGFECEDSNPGTEYQALNSVTLKAVLARLEELMPEALAIGQLRQQGLSERAAAKKLGRDAILAHQASKRGGVLHCRQEGDRTILGGRAALFSIDDILPDGIPGLER